MVSSWLEGSHLLLSSPRWIGICETYDDDDKNHDNIDDNDDHNMNRSRGILITASFFVIVMTKSMMTQILMTI